jgi:hypothetical protein
MRIHGMPHDNKKSHGLVQEAEVIFVGRGKSIMAPKGAGKANANYCSKLRSENRDKESESD